MDALKAGVGPSGQYAINASTVSDDNDKDTLTGDSGNDWFLFNKDNDGVVKDKVTDLSANEFATDTIIRLDPQTGQLRPFPLPSKGVGVRKMIVDAEGRLWYMGSHNGRLGVLE